MNDLIRHITYTNHFTSPLAQLTGPYCGLRINGQKDINHYIRMFFGITLCHPISTELKPQEVVDILAKTIPLYGIINKVRKMKFIIAVSHVDENHLEELRVTSGVEAFRLIKCAVKEFVDEFTEHFTDVRFSEDTQAEVNEMNEIYMASDYLVNLLLEVVDIEYHPEGEAIEVLKKEMDKSTEREELIYYIHDVEDTDLTICQELMNHPGPKSLVCRLAKKYTERIDFSKIPNKPEMFPPINQVPVTIQS